MPAKFLNADVRKALVAYLLNRRRKKKVESKKRRFRGLANSTSKKGEPDSLVAEEEKEKE